MFSETLVTSCRNSLILPSCCLSPAGGDFKSITMSSCSGSRGLGEKWRAGGGGVSLFSLALSLSSVSQNLKFFG